MDINEILDFFDQTNHIVFAYNIGININSLWLI